MNMRFVAPLACAAALLSACSSADEPAEEAAPETPAPVLTNSPTPIAAPDGSPLAPGSWSINESASGASATFGQADTDPLVNITCNRESNGLTLSINTPKLGSQAWVIEAGGTAARLDTMSNGEVVPYQVAAIALDAPVFGGFVQPGGTIEMTGPAGEVIRLPTAPGIRRVFEACA
ncbi:hypothetical protein [Alteraurantiacibacter aquimixticola]|uniref:Lipoprotein antigen n=1 Tax=Alteraurantiacibacter aquimixticola TaxID=2489173 RepID=A0A4V6UGB2_9SPHN|nr:hypothetical protein [Alteraurantiacibacter aquimixticola]TIX50473.1 hypothetical protein E5222_09370 [Alteraurantiacibacter aquimixticola]